MQELLIVQLVMSVLIIKSMAILLVIVCQLTILVPICNAYQNVLMPKQPMIKHVTMATRFQEMDVHLCVQLNKIGYVWEDLLRLQLLAT